MVDLKAMKFLGFISNFVIPIDPCNASLFLWWTVFWDVIALIYFI
jgi:hypothetical protein